MQTHKHRNQNTELNEKGQAQLSAAGIEPLLSPEAMRAAVGGIGRTTEHRWNRRGVISPIYVGGLKRYRLPDVRRLIEEKGPLQ